MFEGKTVLITGSGAGIGKATALRYAQLGANVVLNSRTPQSGHAALYEIEQYGPALYVQADVSHEAQARALVEQAVAHFGGIDVLVNAAGVVLGGRLEETSVQDWDTTLAVNISGVYHMCRFAYPYMRKQGGAIVNIASVVAIKGVPNRAAYAASKGAVLAMSRAMAADYIRENVRVNCVSPGTIDTPSLAERIRQSPDAAQARCAFVKRQPMGRLGDENEIAEAIVFASSPRVGFMTGSNIIIDGGMTLGG